MKVRRAVRVVCLITMMGAYAGAQARQAPPEQTRFSAEDAAFKNPASVPNDVLDLLGKENLVKDALENETVADRKVPASWFSATEVHLKAGGHPDLVVRAEPPLAGANVDSFWFFRNTGRGYELVLSAPAHDVEIRNRRSHGYRDIETVAMTSEKTHTVIYRFDGRRYVVTRDQWENIK